MTSISDTLAQAMRLPEDSGTVQRLHEGGLAVADEGTMSQAIHDVYCGIVADHQHPNDKDREQARALMAAMQKIASSQYPA
jgi:hypothetical protein